MYLFSDYPPPNIEGKQELWGGGRGPVNGTWDAGLGQGSQLGRLGVTGP